MLMVNYSATPGSVPLAIAQTPQSAELIAGHPGIYLAGPERSTQAGAVPHLAETTLA